ncbi:glycosyltransferase LafA [Lentilactobacillus kosonis]|uniref:Glycosyltransferase LafA n=1 Tax=Lentilactobacillus kosonis TaxID=2810561 RepID=A0A401FPY6_9LACO|nr:glycosyltransferase LafA [Lentilactobacillus kosonis]
MGMIGKFVARNLNIPCVHTYHTMYEDYLHYVANGRLLRPVHVKEGTLAFCHNLNGVITPSDRVLDTLTDYGVKSDMRIIPTGIDVDKFNQPVQKNIRDAYQIGKKTPLILTLSRLAFEKDIDHVISLLPQISESMSDVKMMIVGDGPAKDSLKNQVKEMNLTDRVIFTGEISNDEVNAFYQAADVFVSTSTSESQGLTYIEAMAAGLPVIVRSSDYTDGLLDSRSLGQTFNTDDEFISIVSKYLAEPINRSDHFVAQTLANKLHEISAHTFGNRVIDFYRDMRVNQELDGTSSLNTLE